MFGKDKRRCSGGVRACNTRGFAVQEGSGWKEKGVHDLVIHQAFRLQLGGNGEGTHDQTSVLLNVDCSSHV